MERLLADAPTHATAINTALAAAMRWIDSRRDRRDALEAGARGLAFTLARTFAAALLARHSVWAERAQGDMQPRAALALFLDRGLSRLSGDTAAAAELLQAGTRRNG
jgi:acyl-CoA dehydrogenase